MAMLMICSKKSGLPGREKEVIELLQRILTPNKNFRCNYKRVFYKFAFLMPPLCKNSPLGEASSLSLVHELLQMQAHLPIRNE